MTILQVIILGLVQGLTEFLPISSSAHLVIIPFFLGWDIPESQAFPFNVLIQLGSLAAIIAFFQQDIIDIFKAFIKGIKSKSPFEEPASRTGWLLILATIPAGIIGLLVEDIIKQVFTSPATSAFFLFGTAFLLILAELIGKRSRNIFSIGWLDALWMGFFQALAVFPGISRSGSCLAGGMTRNLDRKSASQFTFLMAIPIMIAAGLKSIFELTHLDTISSFLLPLIIGFIVSTFIGYISIKWLLAYVQKHSLFSFAGYCVFLGVATLGMSFLFQADQISVVKIPELQNRVDSIRIGYSPELRWLQPILSQCNQENQDILIFYEEDNEQLASMYDAFLTTHLTTVEGSNIYQIGKSRIQLAANIANPIQSIPLKNLNDLMIKDYSSWDAFFRDCEKCSTDTIDPNFASQPISFWFYPTNSSIQLQIYEKIGATDFNNPSLRIAPIPDLLMQALIINPNAIGYLPEPWLGGSIKPITLTGLSADEFALPIWATTKSQAVGYLKSFLLCIQEKLPK